MKPLILFLILTTLSCSTVDKTSFQQELLQAHREDGSKIDFYLQRNTNQNNTNTLVVYLQGSDCNSVTKDVFLQKHAKSVWPSADWLLIEKRGITAALPYSSDAERADCPSEYIQHDNPRQRIDDIQHVLEQILQRRNYPHVIVIGGSEGAAVAAMYAAQAPFLRAAILINGGGRYFLDDVLHNIRLTVPAENLEEELNGFNGFAMHILTAEPFDLEVSNHGYAWWKEILITDFQSVLNSIKIPTLIIQSGLDKSVSPAGVTAMIESIRTDGKTNFDFVVYPDLDHGLMNSDGNSRADKVIQDVNLWLRKRIFSPSGN